jgi:hypothetical protein
MLVDLKLKGGGTVTWEGADELAAARAYVDCHRGAVVLATRLAHETGVFVGGAARIVEPGDQFVPIPRMPVGTYVKIEGFEPGHALYLAEGTVEGYVDGTVQVLLSRPHNSRGVLTHVDPKRLKSRRPR